MKGVYKYRIIQKMKSQDLKKLNLPESPGVYYFLSKKGEILYIGKATSLKDRVKSYFGKNLILTRSPLIVKMVEEADTLRFTTTDSVLEALMLETFEIKTYKPAYNSKEKDDRSYNFVVITDEDFPRVLIERGRNLDQGKFLHAFGPFPHGGELREALKIVRKIFPFRDAKCKILPDGKKKPCFNAQIGLCPGPCAGLINKTDYRKQIKRLKLFFEGKKTKLVDDIEKEMKKLAKAQHFEEADKLKHTLYALDHIQDIALIKHDIERRGGEDESSMRIEAYDIAHLSGKNVVGVMTVVEDGELEKSQYRKFKLRNEKNDDVGNLKEILSRRLNHGEWRMPNIVVIDGGVGQINMAKSLWKGVDIVAVTKDERHKAREILGDKKLVAKYQREILLANAEAHRFAIGYHRKLRGKGFRI